MAGEDWVRDSEGKKGLDRWLGLGLGALPLVVVP